MNEKKYTLILLASSLLAGGVTESWAVLGIGWLCGLRWYSAYGGEREFLCWSWRKCSPGCNGSLRRF